MHACMHAFRGTYYTADLHPLMRFRLGTFSLQRHPFWHISGIQDFSHSSFYRNIIYTKVFPTDCIFFLRRHETPLLKTGRSVVWQHTSHKQNNLSIGDVQTPCKNWNILINHERINHSWINPLRSQLVRNWSLDYYACLQVVVMQITHRRPTCNVCLHSTV